MKASSSSLIFLLCAACGARDGGLRADAGAAAGSATAPRGASAAEQGPSLAWRGPSRQDWLSWRGPHQNGTSDDECPPVEIDPAQPLWSVPISGRGTPVIADGLVYAMGYQGEGATCVEMLVCLDERDGTVVWQELFPDFLSDVVYSRYSISSPTIDPETGNVYCQTSPGRVIGYTRAGKELWEHSMMEEYGKLTFPNGRTGAPLVVGDKVIVHVISSAWGPLGPARDRFYAFDKGSGECLWSGATPGEMPQDNSFSFPIVFEQEGRTVLAAETGCGHLAVLDVATGDPLWRYRMGSGANSSPVRVGETLIGVHGNENLDDSTIGRLVAVKLPAPPNPGEKQLELGQESERWRLDLEAFSSSPVVAGERLYLTDEDGELACVDVTSGKLLWKEKLAPDQVHASPLHAEGKLYVPMNNGSFYVIQPSDAGAGILDHDTLEGNCLGAPALANLRLYVHTTERLYCFGVGREASSQRQPVRAAAASAPSGSGPAVRLQIVPADFEIEAGESVALRARTLDALGRVVADPAEGVAFATELPLAEAAPGRWSVAADGRPTAGVIRAELAGLKAEARVRVLPALPYREDFERAKLDQPKPDAPADQLFGFPPPFWLSCRTKWDVRDKDGSKVLARTIDNPLFQRAISLFGDHDDRDYTLRADVMVEGNRRGMASVGLVNQRYLVQLRGNFQDLEISSNFESLKVATPCPIEPGTWYTLLTRVDRLPNGATIVRAKCWKRGEEEPRAWTIEVPHAHGHHNGAAGVYGFTLQNRFKAYIDNVQVTPNE